RNDGAAVVRLRRTAPRDTEWFLELPERLARRVPAACYPGVELVRIERRDDEIPDPEPSANAEAVAELVLRRDSVHALRRVELSPDPKGPLCSVLDNLRSGEEAEVAVALWAADGPWHRHLQAKRRSGTPAQVLADMW